MAMKIVLLEDVENLGRVGEIVTVKSGFGRNYLVPQGKALLATKGNLALMGARRKIYEAAAAKHRDAAQEIAGRIGAVSVSIGRKVGESEMLYGSVTTADIAAALAEKGFEIDKRKITLAEPIKALGDVPVTIKIHRDVTATVKVSVVAEKKA